eukprot:g38637.t1
MDPATASVIVTVAVQRKAAENLRKNKCTSKIRASSNLLQLLNNLHVNYTGSNPHLFLCYIDDCIGVASCSHEELEQFINTFHPHLKFTWTISDTSLSFLDLSVSIPGDCLETNIYFKPTDFHSSPLTSIQGTKKTFRIRQRFTCTSTNAVYCICCSRCGLLYIGETKQRLGHSFVEHLHSARDKLQHLPVVNHFNSPSYSLDDMSILGILQCHNDTTRKLEEQHFIFCSG